MGDPGDGWQTVMPTSHSGMERLSHLQLEDVERQILREWETSRGHWSGIGKHTPLDDFTEAKKLHNRFKCDAQLGVGSFGVVEKVKYTINNRRICLARKLVRPRYRRQPIHQLREEANVMEKLDHEHIVKLVGTYCIQTNLYLLLWPVAVCNLDCLLNDLDCLKMGLGDRDDIVSRLHALALDPNDHTAVERTRPATHAAASPGTSPLTYLRQIMGCITRAVAYCHQANIRHLDLKPSNILLNPGRVYLADFGIAKDVHDRDHTMTRGQAGTPKWRAPELHQVQNDWSMKAADVYSLGMVLLSIATLIHDAPLDEFDDMLGELSPEGRAEKLQRYLRKLETLALATQDVDDVNAPTFGPKHIVELASRMLSSTPESRPVIFQVESELVELGGIDQVYHAPCCKKSSRYVTDRMNAKLKLVVDERDRLRAEHEAMAKRLQVLEAKDATYESRLVNERNTYRDHITNLQAQLEAERLERKNLEASIQELDRRHRKQQRPGVPQPASDRQATPGRPSTGTLEMRKRPLAHPKVGAVSQQMGPPAPVPQRSPAPTGRSPRPGYSQTAAVAAAQTLLATIPRRDSRIPSPSAASTAVSTTSPSPDTAGFPLRSRTSVSQIPRAVNPTTPIRSNTPILNRDPSSTDSTQYSMSSSVFSRMSQSRASLADTSVAASPLTGNSPATLHLRRVASPTATPADPPRPAGAPPKAPPTTAPSNDQSDEPEDPAPRSTSPEGVVHGLGLGLTDRERRDSLATSSSGDGLGSQPVPPERESVRDAASVAGSAAPPGTLSPVLSASVVSAASSPRATHAAMAEAVRSGAAGGGGGGGGLPRVPPLPTARSWADVARRNGRRG
ncbi:7632381a-719b-484e-9cdd-68c2337217b5 [Thermothielavioides terrestris]|uniref:Protein kinase domain-containing protein n=2 Tax=Thermothielavioides terrestris TaxID=2587410 RepID=G2QWZ6_THETT|nr:uncharacterized protein THITE_2109579 [Thermothielavioides terrestris NRRL 8126]AEO63962.1 hypothetical protein THITE_2109579 [Thermothielavioides terrestris NRRL 8126]SPQ23298.1 7632381a-719b-484e-9cdd-68c2337217b5 [Thermothielavioides terrestris]